MKIDIQRLREEPYEYEVNLSAAYLSDGSESDTSFSSGHGSVTFRMVGNDILADGALHTEYHGTCGRCLEKASVPVNAEVHLIYWPKDAETGSKIANIEPEEPDFAIYVGDHLDPDEELREVLLVEAPLVALCSPGCKGLCPRCGMNLNKGTCDCAELPEEEVEKKETAPPPEPEWKTKLRALKSPPEA